MDGKGRNNRIAVIAALLLMAVTAYLAVSISMVTLFIVGIPALLAYLFWNAAYLKSPTEPRLILVPFLVTVAGFGFHAIEEYLGHYGPAIGRLFGFAWTDDAFVVIILALLSGLCLVAIGLYRQMAMAGLVASFFLVTRLAEVALFVFPFIPPAIQPGNPETISEPVAGTLMLNMPNYHLGATGTYYFPGMYTVVLPVLPAIVSLWIVWNARAGRPEKGGSK